MDPQTLSAAQLQLLALVTFQHVPISQAGMLRLLPTHWDRAQLQQQLNELQLAGWLEPDWRVPSGLQDRLARFAWSRQEPVPSPGPLEALRPQLTLRELRLALYTGNVEAFAFHWERQRHDFWQPFDPQWLDWLRPPIAERLIAERLRQGLLSREESEYLESRPALLNSETRVEVAFRALLAGRLKSAESLLHGLDTPDALACLAFAQMQRGQAHQAAKSYAAARANLRKLTGRRKVAFTAPYGWLETLALLESGLSSEKTRPEELPEVLGRIEQLACGQPPAAQPWRPGRGLEGLLEALLLAWQGRPQSSWPEELQALEQAGQLWMAAEYAQLLGRGEMHRQLGTRSLLTVLQPRAPWELALEALEQLRPAPTPGSDSRRLAWKVEVYCDGASLTMEPIEQRRGPKGWSEGRPVALARLNEGDYLSQADRAICRCIRQVRTGYYGRTDTFIEIGQAAPHLIGHPLVLHRESGLQLKVRASRPRLHCASPKLALSSTRSRRSRRRLLGEAVSLHTTRAIVSGPISGTTSGRLAAFGLTSQDSDWWLTWDCPPAYRIHSGVLEVLQQSTAELALAGILRDGLLVPPEGQEPFLAMLNYLDILGFDM